MNIDFTPKEKKQDMPVIDFMPIGVKPPAISPVNQTIPQATPAQLSAVPGGYKPMVKNKVLDAIANVGEELIRLPLYPIMAAIGSRKG